MVWVWLLIFLAVCGLALYLLAKGLWGFIRGFREGLRGGGQPVRPSLRSVLFRTVLVTLLFFFFSSLPLSSTTSGSSSGR